MGIRVEQFDDGEVLYLAFDPDGVWAKAEFPDELITVDLNAQGRVIGVEVIGSLARRGASALLTSVLESDQIERPELVKRLLEPEPA